MVRPFRGPGTVAMTPTTPPALPVGDPVPDWRPVSPPPRSPIAGAYVRLEPLDPDAHAGALLDAFKTDEAGLGWTYLPYGPFRDEGAFRNWISESCLGDDPLFFTILDEGGSPAGLAAYLRIDPARGSIEVGHIHYALRLRRTRAATEAMYLLMRRAFDELGYRRYEWKCDALNAASRSAAERLGFTFEGIFRQHVVYKGRNRDTAWYSIIDREWPAVRAAYEAWLAPQNFDDIGRQRTALDARSALSPEA